MIDILRERCYKSIFLVIKMYHSADDNADQLGVDGQHIEVRVIIHSIYSGHPLHKTDS